MHIPSSSISMILILSVSISSSISGDGKRVLYPDFSCHPTFNENRGSGDSPTSGSLLVERLEKECGHNTNPNGCSKACVWEKYNVLFKRKGNYVRNLGDAFDVSMALSKLFKPSSRDYLKIVKLLSQCLDVFNILDPSKTDPCDNDGWESVFECLESAIGCMPVSRGQLMGCSDNNKTATWKVRSKKSINATAYCCGYRIMPCYKYNYLGSEQKVCQVESKERIESLKQCCKNAKLVSYLPPDPREHDSAALKPC